MRSCTVTVSLVLLASLRCFADARLDTFRDQTSCWYSTTSPYTNCDVVGDQRLFDIESVSVTVTQNWIDATISTNYGGGASLGAFNVSPVDGLLPGDLFFYDPSNPQIKFQYAIPLTGHDGYIAGNLYALAKDPRTAFDVLHDSANYYRRDTAVWMAAGEAQAGAGQGVSVADHGLSDAHGEFTIHLLASTPQTSFWANIVKNGTVGIAFESATCANDVLVGMVKSSVPEPSSIVLLGIGVGVLGVLGRRRLSRASRP